MALADVVALLRAALRLLNETTWTQREGAKGSDGKRVHFSSPDAVAFSACGALMRAQADLGLTWIHGKLAEGAIGDAVGARVFVFNEFRGRRFDEVSEAFCRALWIVQQHIKASANV